MQVDALTKVGKPKGATGGPKGKGSGKGEDGQKGKGKEVGKGGAKGGAGKPSTKTQEVKCHYCHKKGHYKQDCRKRLADVEKVQTEGHPSHTKVLTNETKTQRKFR